MTSLQSLIHRRLVILSHYATIKDTARAMCENQIGCALISGPDGNAGGIVTDRDLACYWGTEAPTQDRTVDEIMSRDLIVADENAGLNDIIGLMETHGIRRIPLVSGNTGKKRFVGLVTLDDLIAAKLIEAPRLARIVRRQVGRRLVALERPYPPHIPTARTEVRSEAHKAQTLQRFHAHIARTTGLSQDLIPQITHFILGSLVMRVSMTEGMHFIAQLPDLIRGPLMTLPPGPDKFISSRTIVEELVSRFHFTESHARTVLHRFIAALSTGMSPGALDHLRAQLPEDFSPYFGPLKEPSEPLPETTPSGATAILSVTSPSFPDGGEIPELYTGEGAHRSPQIRWSNAPRGTKEFALICEDLDAKTVAPPVHWVVYAISGAVTGLPEGLPQDPEIRAPVLSRQGKNSAGSIGYQGPMPIDKDEWHRYYFHLYALDHETALPPGATAEELRQRMRGHIVGEGTLMGRYRRTREAVA